MKSIIILKMSGIEKTVFFCAIFTSFNCNEKHKFNMHKISNGVKKFNFYAKILSEVQGCISYH